MKLLLSLVFIFVLTLIAGFYFSQELREYASNPSLFSNNYCSKFGVEECPFGCNVADYSNLNMKQPSSPFGMMAPPPDRCVGWKFFQ